MSVEFETQVDGTCMWLDAYSTHLFAVLSHDEDHGVAITIRAEEARRLRRFLEYVYPASEDESSPDA